MLSPEFLKSFMERSEAAAKDIEEAADLLKAWQIAFAFDGLVLQEFGQHVPQVQGQESVARQAALEQRLRHQAKVIRDNLVGLL